MSYSYYGTYEEPEAKRPKNEFSSGGGGRTYPLPPKIVSLQLAKKSIEGEQPNNVLLLTILNPEYPITCDILHKYISPYGKIQRIVIFEKNGVQAMVEFESVDIAAYVKETLHGYDIYAGCCTLKTEYAKPTRLNVYKNDNKSHDYAPQSSGQVYPSSTQYTQRPVLLKNPNLTPSDSNATNIPNISPEMVNLQLAKKTSPEQPNHVLLITILNPIYTITCEELYNIASSYGKIFRIVIFKKNGIQAMIEFDIIESARNVKDNLHGSDIYSGCCTLKIEYAKQDKLNVYKNDSESYDYTNPGSDQIYPPGTGDTDRPVLLNEPTDTTKTTKFPNILPQMVNQQLAKKSIDGEKHNHVLLITVINPAYPITCDVLHSIASRYGQIVRIVIFKKNGIQALIEFDSNKSARDVKENLHGCDIYSGCCTLKIEYGKQNKLNVYKNNNESYDYTQSFPDQIYPIVTQPTKRRVLLPNLPANM